MTVVDGSTVIGVHARSIALRFTVSSGLPEVTADSIQWFFVSANGSQMELTQDSRHGFSSGRLSLTINPVVLSDEGNYTLQVNHITGTITSDVFLEVHG